MIDRMPVEVGIFYNQVVSFGYEFAVNKQFFKDMILMMVVIQYHHYPVMIGNKIFYLADD